MAVKLKPYAYKCKNCGKKTYPQRARCLECKGTEFEELNMPPKGKILSFSKVSQLPWGIDERLLTLGVIEFENGIRSMGQITADEVSIGDKVTASWEKVRALDGEDIYGWKFTPSNKS
ncbi:MAG: hypothetical protein ABIH00_04210 [Armatimonadota bacterium]